MNVILKLLKKHPIAITFFILHTYLCVNTSLKTIDFHHTWKQHPELSGIAAGGEAIGILDFFLVTVTGIIFFINFCYAFIKTAEMKFYLWIAVIVVVETMIVFKVG